MGFFSVPSCFVVYGKQRGIMKINRFYKGLNITCGTTIVSVCDLTLEDINPE